MSYIRISSVDSLDSSSKNLDTVVQVGPLSNIRFSVFALGSSAYPNFCAFGRFVDNMLAELGGERMVKLSTGDELCGQEQAFTDWSRKVFRGAADVFCVGDEVNMSEILSTASLRRTTWSLEDIKLVTTDAPLHVASCLSSGSNRRVVALSLTSVTPLYEIEGDARKTIRVRLELQDTTTDFSYLPGDHLGVFPENLPSVIDLLAKRLTHLNFDQTYNVFLREVRNNGFREVEDWVPHSRLPRVSLREAFKRFIDIMAAPTQQLLSQLSCFCTKETEKKELQSLSSDAQKYEDWKAHNQPSFLDLLMMFPSLEPPAEFILTQMPPLQPRFYSISSAPLFNAYQRCGQDEDSYFFDSCASSPNAPSNSCNTSTNAVTPRIRVIESSIDYALIDLTIAVVKYFSPAGNEKFGVCSNFLFNTGLTQPGHTVYGFIRSAPNFRMPDKDDVPVVMIGPGTGIAPFRGFWLHRSACIKMQNHKRFGPMSLFFGCRLPSMQLYREEVQDMKNEGVLRDVFIAFSRCPDRPKVRHLYSFIACHSWTYTFRNRIHLLNESHPLSFHSNTFKTSS